MTITVETHASIGHARRRDDAGSHQDRVPEHLKCVVCLGEGKHPVCDRIRGKLVVSDSVTLNPKP